MTPPSTEHLRKQLRRLSNPLFSALRKNRHSEPESSSSGPANPTTEEPAQPSASAAAAAAPSSAALESSSKDPNPATNTDTITNTATMAKPRIAIVYYSLYGHIRKLAEAELAGIREAGGDATLLQVPETLPDEVLVKMKAPPKDSSVKVLDNVADLTQYDGLLMGIPTRFGNFPAQWKSVVDQMGQIWMAQTLRNKYAGLFISTGTQGGGQESTALATMSTLAHMGLIYVPFGYPRLAEQGNTDEVHGGSPWGAGTFSGGNGSRQPTELELSLAKAQGLEFYKTLARVNFQE